MGRGDALASGQKSATFVMGGDKKDAPIILHNTAKEEDIPAVIDNSALFVPKKPEVYYKGRPLSDRILIKRKESRESNSSIIIPDSAKGKSDIGYVVSVSPNSKLELKPGALILFDKFASVGQELMLLDESGIESEHLLVQEIDVLMEMEEVRTEPQQIQ